MAHALMYKGDLHEDGDVRPFRVALRDGISSGTEQILRAHEALALVDDPVQAQGILIRGKTKFLLQDDFAHHPGLQHLIRVGVGTDNINMDQAAAHGVATLNTPGASTRAVALRAAAFVHAWAARILQGTQSLQAHTWPKGERATEPIDLSEKTLGIVGYGRIGQETRKLLEPMFRQVLFSDARAMEGATDLESLLQASDVISVHVGGSREVLGRAELRQMKQGSLLVNTARGKVIDTATLLERMEENDIHAALDVFPEENQKMFENPVITKIIAHRNFLGTPHTAASDPVTQERLGLEGVARMVEFATQGIINPQDLPGHTLPRLLIDPPSAPGTRILLTHTPTAHASAQIDDILARHRLHRIASPHSTGQSGDFPLAATTVDVQDGMSGNVLDAVRAIRAAMEPYRMRLMIYADK